MRHWIPLTPTMLKLVEAAQYVDWLNAWERRDAMAAERANIAANMRRLIAAGSGSDIADYANAP